jgi:hypothetical protein
MAICGRTIRSQVTFKKVVCYLYTVNALLAYISIIKNAVLLAIGTFTQGVTYIRATRTKIIHSLAVLW